MGVTRTSAKAARTSSAVPWKSTRSDEMPAAPNWSGRNSSSSVRICTPTAMPTGVSLYQRSNRRLFDRFMSSITMPTSRWTCRGLKPACRVSVDVFQAGSSLLRQDWCSAGKTSPVAGSCESQAVENGFQQESPLGPPWQRRLSTVSGQAGSRDTHSRRLLFQIQSASTIQSVSGMFTVVPRRRRRFSWRRRSFRDMSALSHGYDSCT